MKTLRAFFLLLQLREKILVVAFALMIAAVWASNFNRRAWQFQRQAATATLDLKKQQQWLDDQPAIEANAMKTAARLDASHTLDAPLLLATISSLAGEANLNVTSNTESRDESTGQFNIHTREFILDKADYGSLIKFYLSLQARSPYVGIERYTQVPDKVNPALSRVSLLLSATEVVR